MSATLVTGIAELVTNDPARERGLLGIVEDAAIVLDDDRVNWIGSAHDAPDADDHLDLAGRAVLPGFVDSHSHLVFAGDRSAEFAARMTGTPYDGGGIAVTREATRAASDDELRALVAARVQEMAALGTTTIEIKSGYGLSIGEEVRALRIAREFTADTTYLGAHVVPPEHRGDRAAYVDLCSGAMLEACAPHARWIDVFCEPHSEFAFTKDEARQILTAGRERDLLLRLHGNQLGHGPGVQLAVELGAASVDHCTYLSDADVDALAGSDTVATLLPGVEFSTRSPYPDARRLVDAGVDVALASDCNPGTCYSSSMPLMVALAVREMGMSPEEAVYAATAGSARSLRREDIGGIRPGTSVQHLAVLSAPSYRHLAYRAGMPIAQRFDLAGLRLAH
ncbi:imidazolonepropionase [Leekyejoonella antrihumi]|uniref:Imidazolonepropionase n=1 Tax=Leekyejoonella antrihumi TaxID=1660198 RepID=A0A563DVA6_9MICO|nr:imidazolonepropionase [Leekyejoonella antrihumi]TWP34197.1 imidazolonepropionase [Leekyejoonella antrihumi]